MDGRQRRRWARRLALLGLATLLLSAGLHLALYSPTHPREPPELGVVALVLPVRDLPAGHVLSMDDLYLREFPARPETRSCVHAEEAVEIVGMAPKVLLPRDRPIYRADLTAGPATAVP